jgi:hypothetical protein
MWIFVSTSRNIQAETKIHDPEVMALTSLILSTIIGTFIVGSLTPEKSNADELDIVERESSLKTHEAMDILERQQNIPPTMNMTAHQR